MSNSGRLSAGTTVGRFRIVRELGRGAMGIVYEAHDDSGTPVALKVVLPIHAGDPKFMNRFRREARASITIVHPNVVRTVDVGEEKGLPWMAIELCRGGALDDFLKKRGVLPWREAAAIAAKIARGLEAVHAQGFVHRDVKPANVLLDEQGTPKLSDFGLVRGDPLPGAGQLTKTGDVIGTPDYMSPEQLGGERQIDGRTDLYALGVVLIELLTGTPPFTGSSFEVVKHHLADPPPTPSERGVAIPPALESLIARLLEKEPSSRPASAGEVASALENLAESRGGRGPLVAAIALVAIALVATAAWLLRARPVEPAPRDPAPGPSIPPVSPRPPQAREPAWLAKRRAAKTAPDALPPGVSATDDDGVYRHGATGLELVWVPGGSFLMGTDGGADRDQEEESPRHRVIVSGLFVGRFEVTNEEFAKFVAATTHRTSAEKAGHGGGVLEHPGRCKAIEGATWRAPYGDGPTANAFPRHPVVQVSYDDARAYCAWATRSLDASWAFDLPSEAEWEKAAGWDEAKGLPRRHPWGDGDAIPRREKGEAEGRGDGELGRAIARGRPLTHEVDAFPERASPARALGMAGNAWEWTLDQYFNGTYGARARDGVPAKDPIQRFDPPKPFVIRGGSWAADVDWWRVARRNMRGEPDLAACDLGFRVTLGRPRKN